MSVEDKIAAKKKAAKASRVPPAEPPPAATSPPAPAIASRAARFRTAGLVDDDLPESPPDTPPAPESTSPAGRAHAPVTEAGGPAPRSQRFSPSRVGAALERAFADDASTPPRAHASPPAAWLDNSRPPGSNYSEEEWAAAEKDNPDCVVMEVLKTHERALVAKPRNGLDSVLLERSLLIHERVQSEWSSMASATLEHFGEHGRYRYAVVRSHAQREKFPWADGSVMRFEDANYVAAKEAATKTKTLGERSRSQRFGR